MFKKYIIHKDMYKQSLILESPLSSNFVADNLPNISDVLVDVEQFMSVVS